MTDDNDSKAEPVSGETQRITAVETGRADKELARHFPDAGRKQLAEMFDEGVVRVNGKRIKKGDFISAGDVIEVARAPVSGEALRPQPDSTIELVVLLERQDIVVVDKRAGVPSQPLRAGELGTVANALAHRFPECASIGDDPRDGGLVHRLDIGTSGVLVAARTPEAYRALRDAFADKAVEKTYLAITEGRPVSKDTDAPLAQRGKKVAVDQTDGLAAYTAFTVEKSWSTSEGGRTMELALVRCVAQTGRMHQVRAHLAHLAAPILGDTLYGGSPHDGGFFLHASSIAFTLGGERVEVTSPMPARFEAVLHTRT
jgi:23S rRNA pseudouridine1911/1915/1917 synthase